MSAPRQTAWVAWARPGLLAHRVRIEGAVGLVGDEVAREEHERRDREHGDRARMTAIAMRPPMTIGVAASRKGRRPPSLVSSRSDQTPTTSGSHSATSPSRPMIMPITALDSTNSRATTGV